MPGRFSPPIPERLSRNAREGHLPASRPDCPARDARPARCFVNHDDAVILKQDIQRDVFRA